MITDHRQRHRSHSNQELTTQHQYGGAEVDSKPKKAFTMGTSMLRLTALSCFRSFPTNIFGRIKIPTLSRWGERLVTLVAVAVVFTWLLRHNREGSNEGRYMAEQEVGGDPSDASPRVAVCFFGLTRSLRWTLPSLQQRVFDVLRREGMRVDVFLHTYHVMEVHNERAGEKDIDYSPYLTDFHELHPVRSLVTNQDDFDLAWPEPISLTHYNWNYPAHLAAGVIRNVFRAYWSIAMVWGLVAEYASTEGLQYDAVVLARPDVWFHVDIDLPRRTFPLPERTVFLPSFETNLATGGRKNDRFAYGCFDTMRVMMNRIATLLDANAGRFDGEIDSEWVMGRHIDSNGISVETMEFSVTRVRLTGDIPFFDHGRVREACESGVDPMACKMLHLDYRFPIFDNDTNNG